MAHADNIAALRSVFKYTRNDCLILCINLTVFSDSVLTFSMFLRVLSSSGPLRVQVSGRRVAVNDSEPRRNASSCEGFPQRQWQDSAYVSFPVLPESLQLR